MAREYIELGATPCEETCVQVGSENYSERARMQCMYYRDQLLRQFPNIPDGARIGIKSFPHDFGSYVEVVCYYDDTDEASIDYAFTLEREGPTHWDDMARRELIGRFVPSGRDNGYEE